MTSYVERLKDAVGNAVCSVADLLDNAANYTFGTPPGSIGGLACNDPTPPPPLSPPFTGGQCPIPYTVVAGGTVDPSVNPPNYVQIGNELQWQGPITPITRITGTSKQFGFSHAGGETFYSTFDTDLQPNGTGNIQSVTPAPGTPDDCGDPPIPPPTAPPSQPINFTYINNEGDNVDVSGDVNIGIPILIAPFTLVAPVTVNVGGIDLNGSVTLSPNFEVTISPSFGLGGGQPPAPIEPENDDPPEDDPDEPIECEDAPLKGLVVTLNFSPSMRATEIRQDGSLSSLAVPRAAILYFIAKEGNRSLYMPPIDLKSRSQYVPTPFNANVICWRIHTEPGVSVGSTRPIFAVPTS